jgi:hypothetical protein
VSFDVEHSRLYTRAIGNDVTVFRYGYYDLTTGAFVEISDPGNTHQISTMVILKKPSVKIKEIHPDAVTIYPNPSSGLVHISSLSADASVHILDVSGRIIDRYTLKAGETSLNLNLTSGLYFVQIHTKGEKITQKLIIK